MSYPVSVIIPAHNAVRTVRRAIDSAFAAGAREVIAVEDGSTDDTSRLLYSIKHTYPRLYVYDTDGQMAAGVCHARNMGISRAQEKFIIPLDADDTLTEGGVKALYEAAAPNTVVYGNHLSESGEMVSAPNPERLAQKNLTGATFGFWREDWLKAGGYHPDFNLGCEDWALMCALVQAGCRLVKVDAAVYVYASGGGRAARCARYGDAIRQLLREHYPAVFDAQQNR